MLKFHVIFGSSLFTLGLLSACSSSPSPSTPNPDPDPDAGAPVPDSGNPSDDAGPKADANDASPGTPGDDGGTPCAAQAGGFPQADCRTDIGGLCAASTACAIASTCGDTSTCMPLATNAGTIQSFRMRHLTIVAPASLATPFIQTGVFDKNVDLKETACAENGNGSLSWLMQLDTTTKKVKLGGAPPSADPRATGYCFYNATPPNTSTKVSPVTLQMASSDGLKYTSTDDADVGLPLFLNGDVNDAVTFPISHAQLHELTMSADGQCIGQLHTNALDTTCSANAANCEKWSTAGTLAGYITLEQADSVIIADAGESLCVLLTQSAGVVAADSFKHCARDGSNKIFSSGDYCSTTSAPGGCADSYWFAATFAASAVKINDGTGVAECAP